MCIQFVYNVYTICIQIVDSSHFFSNQPDPAVAVQVVGAAPCSLFCPFAFPSSRLVRPSPPPCRCLCFRISGTMTHKDRKRQATTNAGGSDLSDDSPTAVPDSDLPPAALALSGPAPSVPAPSAPASSSSAPAAASGAPPFFETRFIEITKGYTIYILIAHNLRTSLR